MEKTLHFTKMHGLGNDYLYMYGRPRNPEKLSVRLSDRHFGVGSDGIILILPSDNADFKMRIFNADGSEAKMCGNGIRCVGKYVYDKGYTTKKTITVETLSGIKTLELKVHNRKVYGASVDMGNGEVFPEKTIRISESPVTLTPVSVGNPHAVIFVPDADKEDISGKGKAIEHHSEFPGGVNVEFVSVIGKNRLRMRVWERGSGITMACGTGACASVLAAVSKGLADRNTDVSVQLDGGVLSIKVLDDDKVIMTGPAESICEVDVPENE